MLLFFAVNTTLASKARSLPVSAKGSRFSPESVSDTIPVRHLGPTETADLGADFPVLFVAKSPSTSKRTIAPINPVTVLSKVLAASFSSLRREASPLSSYFVFL